MAGNLELAIKITADGKSAVIDLEKVGAAAGRMREGLESASKTSVQAANAATQANARTSDSLERMAKVAGGLFALNQFAGYAKQALDLAEGYKQMEGRLRLATSTSAEFADAQASIARIAAAVGAPLGETTQLYTRMAPVLKQVGYEQRQVSDLSEIVAKSLRLSGAGAQETASTMLQFAQAMGAGVLRGDEFNSLMENSPVLMRKLAQGLGEPIGQLRKMAEEGELSSKRVAEALLKMKGEIDREFSSLPVSVSQAWQRLANDVQVGIGEMDKSAGATATMAAGLEFVRANLDSVEKAAGLMVAGFVAFGTAAALATPLGAAIAGIAAAAVALTAAFKALGAEQKKVQDETAATDAAMNELNRSAIKLASEKADPGIIEGVVRLRQALAAGDITAQQASRALGSYIQMVETGKGLATQAEAYFKPFLPDAKKYQLALKELDDMANAARAQGKLDEAAYQRARLKIIDDFNDQAQKLYQADARAKLASLAPPSEAARLALEKLDAEFAAQRAAGLADERKYQDERARIIEGALRDNAGRALELRRGIAERERRALLGDTEFAVEQIRKKYQADIDAAKGEADSARLVADIERQMETEIAELRKRVSSERVSRATADTDALLDLTRRLADGEVDAAMSVAGAWRTASASRQAGGGEKSLNEIFAGGAGTRTGADGSTVTTKFFFANGGPIVGPGSGTSDSILARVSNGEYVVRSAAVDRYGTRFLDAINSMALPRFAEGGRVGGGGATAGAPSAGITIQNVNLPGVKDARQFVDELRQMMRTDPNLLTAGMARAG